MTSIRRSLLLLGVSTALCGSATAHAQLGGLIKRKAKQAVTGQAKEQPADTVDNDARMKEIYAKNPNIVPITTDQLVRVEKALKFEISERDALRKEKPPKTQEEYQICSGNAVLSPEIMKISQDFADKNANASVDEMMKAQQKMQEQIQAAVLKRCGEDPKEWAIRRDARLAEVEARASDIAMPEGWVPRSTGLRVPMPAVQWGSDAGDSEEKVATIQMPHPFLIAYANLKERIAAFCLIIGSDDANVQLGRSGVGVAVPQVGQKGRLITIYSNDEAKALSTRCVTLGPMIQQVGSGAVYIPTK